MCTLAARAEQARPETLSEQNGMKRKLQTRHLATRVAYKLALAAVRELKLSARYAYRPYRAVAEG